jgi:hypothetical protein
LKPEEEKEFIEGMTQTRMQGLKDLGLVTEKGQPINNEVKSLMTAYGLNRPTQTPAPAPAQNQQQQSASPAAANTPAAIPTANSVTVGNKVYNRPANFTDDQWNAYKKSVGATK